MQVVVNNTVLSNLSRVRRPELLQVLFGDDAVSTEQVRDERVAGERLRLIPVCDWDWLQVVTLTDDELKLMARLRESVDLGEASCLAVAYLRKMRFLTDDRDARRLAQAMQISISGTLGVLQLLVDEKLSDLAAADALLTEMIQKGYRSPVSSLTQLSK